MTSILLRLRLPAAFILAYIALDAVSFIAPLHGLNITPWNPAPALAMVYLIHRERAAFLSLSAALLIGEWWIRGLPPEPGPSFLSIMVLAVGYLVLGKALRLKLRPGDLLDDRLSLLSWLFIVAIGTCLVSVLYLTTLVAVGLLPSEGWQRGVLQFWVGDGVGIAVTMPLVWWLSGQRGRALLRAAISRIETFGYLLLGLLSLVAAFAFGGESGFKLLYLLFIPIVWAAARQGMAGAIISASALQTGVIAATQILGFSSVTIAELQILALALAIIGFLVGAIVDEQRRTSEELRQSLRLAAAGEMAGALAHELNQPLTAMNAYASACETLLRRGESGDRLQAAIQGMLEEGRRTADIVSRLRDFFRTGATKLELIELQTWIEKALRPVMAQASRKGIELVVAPVPQAQLLADPLQLEVVLRNIMNNAMEAAKANSSGEARVWLSARKEVGERITICIEDSGAGLSAQSAIHLFEPFQTTKSTGMGLGLVISRAIVETHGGRLWGEVADHGIFKLSLPLSEPAHDR